MNSEYQTPQPDPHVFKGNKTYNNMLANILPLHILLTPWVGSKGHYFFERCHVAYQINGNEA